MLTPWRAKKWWLIISIARIVSAVQCHSWFTLFRNQIQPERSATDQFSSNYHNSYIYQSFHWFFKKNHWVHFEKRPFLRFLGRFGPFRHFWPVFFVFLGDFKYFLDTEHHGGWPRVNLIFCTFFIFGRFWIFGPFFGFWLQWRFGAFLGVLVSYKVPRGIILFVGRVFERLWGFLGGSGGV